MLKKRSNPLVVYGNPMFTGVMAKLALWSATTMSQLMTRSTAPPHTEPDTRAITTPG
ncbi:hypothetical protein D3C86_1896190 [compost metagenome]